MQTCKLLLAVLVAAALASAHARGTRQLTQKVTNACEEACTKAVEPICVSHFDTMCKPSWWMNAELNREGCMGIPADLPRTRRVMWNSCKYRCIKAQFDWEQWRLERVDGKKTIKMSAWCKRQWKKFGFSADPKCQKC
ncbi:hypothetical protein C2E20_3258 [Micractinium conductrix]|uniref:Uncharacterized protein n=1 Tax=Micractinium conductrix TaxID=554055 RepID=A0A2P6VHB1_9CHLO|nr:hypothetical protein C2E20_3258 [Micractinium conductrix]|eukprot:PSC73486.1 hypothetical protein C2E20_3258 [Micractinium conductrix]